MPEPLLVRPSPAPQSQRRTSEPSVSISLVAVTAFLVSWVTVGSIQLPAEMIMLGKRFAIYRNLICFGLSVLIAVLAVATLSLLS
jgi:hypothetical protein